MGPQAGDPQGREEQPNSSLGAWGRFSSSLVLPTFQSPFFFFPVKVQSSTWHICIYRLLFSVHFSICPPALRKCPDRQQKTEKSRGSTASPVISHKSHFRPRNLDSMAQGSEERRRGICSGLEHLAGVTLPNALSEISFLLSNCMFSSGAANPKLLPMPPFPLSTNDNKC